MDDVKTACGQQAPGNTGARCALKPGHEGQHAARFAGSESAIYYWDDDTPGSRHRSFLGSGAYPSIVCGRCNQQAWLLHHAQAPAPTLLECSCCGDLVNLGLLQYVYSDGASPDVLAERERAVQIAESCAPLNENDGVLLKVSANTAREIAFKIRLDADFEVRRA